MDLSNYRDTIKILNQATTRNKFGTNVTVWMETATRRTEAKPLKGDLLLQAGQLRAGIPYEFKLHYEKNLDLTTESKIIFRNLEFAIHTLYDFESDFTEWYILAFGKRIETVITPPDNTNLFFDYNLDYQL